MVPECLLIVYRRTIHLSAWVPSARPTPHTERTFENIENLQKYQLKKVYWQGVRPGSMAGARRSMATRSCSPATTWTGWQGLTLVRFSAQLEPFLDIK
jgi:hypothetical protein